MTSAPVRRYRGRFAPSPTGLLHAGSLLTAVASCLDARRHGGEWWLRIEDLDPPREMPGAADDILHTLETFGFAWDGEVVYQSRRHHLYRAALDALIAGQAAYPCFCSRKAWHERARQGVDGFVYDGLCARGGNEKAGITPAWRLRVPDEIIGFDDRIVGHYQQNLARDIGDFVLLRADGQYAYQLAVVVDDAAQGVNAVVRGADLLDSTARQVWLQQCLEVSTPSYAHLPVALNAAGEKLSKQTKAAAVDPAAGVAILNRVMRFLGQATYPGDASSSLREFWQWAVATWDLARVPSVRAASLAENDRQHSVEREQRR